MLELRACRPFFMSRYKGTIRVLKRHSHESLGTVRGRMGKVQCLFPLVLNTFLTPV